MVGGAKIASVRQESTTYADTVETVQNDSGAVGNKLFDEVTHENVPTLVNAPEPESDTKDE